MVNNNSTTESPLYFGKGIDMKIQLISDLHLDFQPKWGRSLLSTIKAKQVDILIIAGDLAEAIHPAWEQALVELTAHYPYVLMVLGNHEYYHSSPEEVVHLVNKLQQKLLNLHILENQTIMLERATFAGTTLWFDDTANIHEDIRSMNDDFHLINSLQAWVSQRNQTAKRFLASVNADVVITHHLPSPKSITPQYQNHPLNYFFVCDVEEIIQDIQPQYWLHGHTHTRCDYRIGQTRVIANPFGYPEETANYYFVKQLILELNTNVS